MEGKKILKRLYVGGLGHTVSEGELQERFSKFGEVTNVEILTRKDEQGNPMKSFAYINISISESDLKKCMSILNKTKWKGGTLQIELAKESFLHRCIFSSSCCLMLYTCKEKKNRLKTSKSKLQEIQQSKSLEGTWMQ
uniref:Nucleolar protein 8 n=1 Tax=Crocodylus porosus TaxID=8502 RepID=A0A7M4FQT7_CROPO